MKGTETWICLPPEARPQSWSKFRKPVVRLLKALYGHPDSGSFWEEHCDQAVRRAGFKPVHECWPSCYFHPKLQLFLVIYVDDFKLSGPQQHLQQGWRLLRGSLNIEPERPLGLYLGCVHERYSIKLPNGQLAIAIRYNMEDYLRATVRRFRNMAGTDAVLKFAATPFLVEDHKDSPQGGPTPGPVQECPWCKHTFPPARVFESIDKLDAWRREQQKAGKGTPTPPTEQNRGRLQPIASSILMGLLYAGRLARFDLLRAINHLACYVTRWSTTCDRRLHRLVNYTHSSYEQRMIGWVGDKMGDIEPHLFADADLAGCTFTQRSTNGLHLALRGPNTSFPIAGGVRDKDAYRIQRRNPS